MWNIGLIEIILGHSRYVTLPPPAGTTEEWEQEPRGMMEYYQSLDYELGQSIADLVDNCYDANASKIDVSLGKSGDEQLHIRILDNGDGMSKDQLSKAMMLGGSRERDDSELGLFGIGMKLSSLSQADQVTVCSHKNGKRSIRRIDAKYIKSSNKNEILKIPTNSEIYNQSKDLMVEEDWVTMVLLEEMQEAKFVTFDMERIDAIEKEVYRIGVHLGLTFHRILEKWPDRKLYFQGKPVEAIDPMMRNEKDHITGVASNKERISVSIDGESVSVRTDLFIVPARKLRGDPKKSNMCEKGYWKARDMQGIYLYRNDRLIQYCGWHRLFGDTSDEHSKLGKISIDIPSNRWKWFGLNPTKTGMRLPDEFMRKLSEACKKDRKWGAINKGKEMPFKQAAEHRYDKEGNEDKIAKIHKSRASPPKKKLSTSEEEVEPVTSIPSTKRSRTPKPKPGVVKSMDEEGDELVVRLDKNKAGFDQLKKHLRQWLS